MGTFGFLQGIFGETGSIMATFKIQGDTIDLTKLLKVTGLCSTGGMAQIAATVTELTHRKVSRCYEP